MGLRGSAVRRCKDTILRCSGAGWTAIDGTAVQAGTIPPARRRFYARCQCWRDWTVVAVRRIVLSRERQSLC